MRSLRLVLRLTALVPAIVGYDKTSSRMAGHSETPDPDRCPRCGQVLWEETGDHLYRPHCRKFLDQMNGSA